MTVERHPQWQWQAVEQRTELDALRKQVEDGIPIPVLCSGIHNPSRRKCQMPAARVLVVGCVHEHIGLHFVCAGHGSEELGCHHCWKSGQGHECLLAEIVDPSIDVEKWMVELINPSDPAGIDMAEWRGFIRDHLYDLVPAHLRTLDRLA